MLKKMGWRDGEGLGKFKSGEVNPLTLDIKFDKKGLMAAEEGRGKDGKGGVVTLTACKDLSGKHPVSALTELCSKRRWGPPVFTQAFECGPPHKKQYVFKVGLWCQTSSRNYPLVSRSMLTAMTICPRSPWTTRRRARPMPPWPASSRWVWSQRTPIIQSKSS